MIQIDKGTLTEADYENTKLITQDDGTQVEVYISRAGNVVTPPALRRNIDTNRQQLCWDLYVKSIRDGDPSAQEAAKKAGFAPNTVLNITNQKWFKDRKKRLGRSRMVQKAERNLSRGLNVQWSKMKLLEDGTEVEEIDKDIFRTVIDVSKYVTSTLAKDEGYSTKTEIGGKMESEIKINSISYADPIEIENKIIDDNIKQIEEIVLEEISGKPEEVIKKE